MSERPMGRDNGCVDDEVVNLTDILSICPINLGSLNVFA